MIIGVSGKLGHGLWFGIKGDRCIYDLLDVAEKVIRFNKVDLAMKNIKVLGYCPPDIKLDDVQILKVMFEKGIIL